MPFDPKTVGAGKPNPAPTDAYDQAAGKYEESKISDEEKLALDAIPRREPSGSPFKLGPSGGQ